MAAFRLPESGYPPFFKQTALFRFQAALKPKGSLKIFPLLRLAGRSALR